MTTFEEHELTLPPQAVANLEFPYESELESARRFLSSRGITAVRPVYGTPSRNARLTKREVSTLAKRLAANAGPPVAIRSDGAAAA